MKFTQCVANKKEKAKYLNFRVINYCKSFNIRSDYISKKIASFSYLHNKMNQQDETLKYCEKILINLFNILLSITSIEIYIFFFVITDFTLRLLKSHPCIMYNPSPPHTHTHIHSSPVQCSNSVWHRFHKG